MGAVRGRAVNGVGRVAHARRGIGVELDRMDVPLGVGSRMRGRGMGGNGEWKGDGGDGGGGG